MHVENDAIVTRENDALLPLLVAPNTLKIGDVPAQQVSKAFGHLGVGVVIGASLRTCSVRIDIQSTHAPESSQSD